MIEIFSKVKLVRLLLSCTLSVITITWVDASHLRAGEITVERRNCNSREVWITVTVYTNTASDVKFGEDGILAFGDGTQIVIPRVENVLQPQLGPNIGIASYTVRHTYGSLDSYLISYVEPNRNGGVLNMDDSFWTTFYLETRFSLAVLGCNYSPKLRIPPIDQACAGQAFYHNPGAYDFNPVGPADSISYEEVDPYRDRGLPVVGYVRPNEYGAAPLSEAGTPATYSINPIDGTLIWDAPKTTGEYNVAFIVVEWRKINGTWQRIGYVRRDMQIIVHGNCENKRPFLIIPDDTCVIAGANINKEIKGYDRNNPPNPIRLQAYSEVLEFPASKSPARIIGDTISYTKHLPPDTLARITFDWNTICAHIKGQAYDVVFKVTNDPPPYPTPPDPHIPPNLATFESWKIKVIAPAPVLDTAIVSDPPDRNVLVTWASYDCAEIADQSTVMQIWRRVGETNYEPGNCDTGMPESLGFSLIATTPLTDVQFLDTNNGQGLERGVKYCYRLVAVFGDRGAESYVSNEVCMEPMDISAPLITEVTVEKTGLEDGKIKVSWIPPLNPQYDLDDYQYQLERAEAGGFIPVSPKIDTFNFSDAGINTLNQQYSYRVMLFADGVTKAVDSSSVASSVWLDLATENTVINLSWRATVPWSNQVQLLKHAVHRGDEGAVLFTDLNPVPIDSVEVTEDGLRYRDAELDPTKVFCYAVVTKGSYGNDTTAIPDPLINRSQINCAAATLTPPPCEPVIAAFSDPCKDFFEKYSCNSTEFYNVVRWNRPEGSCGEDIKGYRLYRASTADAPLSSYVEVFSTLITDTFAVDNVNLSSQAYCYRVKAESRSGSLSEFSEKVCSENCPNYELPNVFTPNGDKCNDFFSAFGAEFIAPEPDGDPTDDCKPSADDEYVRKCARFVERVDFKVFNRWGREIYDYVGQRGNENTIYIHWDGRDKSGKELAAGIYFYSADVTFSSTASGGKSVKTIKGWVHLIR